MRTRPTLRITALAAALTLALAACGEDPTVEPEEDMLGTPEEEPDEDVPVNGDEEANEADIEFAQGMIVHHQGAIEMAELVDGRTDRQELIDLADEIIDVQEAEIEMLQAMLERMGADETPMDGMGDMDDMDHPMPMDEMGMMSEEEMAELEAAEGEEFDRLFLEHMIVHHEGAIDMSEQVLAEGEDEEVAALAEEVIEVQEAEIEQMREWLEEWGLT